MEVGIDIEKFLNNIESYAEDTGYDYTYYLVKRELERIQITDKMHACMHKNKISWCKG